MAKFCARIGHGWVPSFLSSTIFIQDSRAHARYERVPVRAFDEAVQYGLERVRTMSQAGP